MANFVLRYQKKRVNPYKERVDDPKVGQRLVEFRVIGAFVLLEEDEIVEVESKFGCCSREREREQLVGEKKRCFKKYGENREKEREKKRERRVSAQRVWNGKESKGER